MPEPIATLNEESLRTDLRKLVRKTVEDTLNGLLEKEADHYNRKLTTTSGEVTLRMLAGNKAADMADPVAEVFPDAAYQRCTVHLHGNLLSRVPRFRRPKAAAMFKAIHAMK